MLRRITRNLEEAEDLTQEAFLRAFRALDRYDTGRPFRPWLWTIGIRLALHSIARKGRTNVSLDDGDPDERPRDESAWMADPRSVESIDANLLGREIDEAMRDLDADHRAVLILRAIEERSYEEISEILGVPKGTVMSRLFRARNRLRARLRGSRGEPAGGGS